MRELNTNLDFGTPGINGIPNGMDLTVFTDKNHTMHAIWGI